MRRHAHREGGHSHEQIACILAGQMNGESHLLGPGGLLHIPPHVEHWGEAVGDEPVLNLDVFTPLREEYAPGPKKA